MITGSGTLDLLTCHYDDLVSIEIRAFAELVEATLDIPLNVYNSIHAYGSVPANWVFSPGGMKKYNIKNKQLYK